VSGTDRIRELRSTYDAQLRGEAEANGEFATQDGPLFRTLFGPQAGFVSYQSLDGLEGGALDDLIARTIAYFRDSTSVDEFEWKTRGHDLPADLGNRLVAQGFEPQEPETVMIGEVGMLAGERPLPAGVSLRRIGFEPDGTIHSRERTTDDVRRMIAMQDEVFGRPAHQDPAEYATSLLEHPLLKEAWIVEAGGDVVSAGRLELVPGTDFAGLWGGATRAEWRGQGIYRALTAARARSAQAKGVLYLNSDSTEYSRPILERSGFLAVTTTTPYIWRRST
jgi:GNAT superfamily N-acetyltransferase